MRIDGMHAPRNPPPPTSACAEYRLAEAGFAAGAQVKVIVAERAITLVPDASR